MCARNCCFEENFSNLLKATFGDSECLKRFSLSSVVLKDDLRQFTDYESYWLHRGRHGNFDFSNRLDAEEVEWFLNKPIDDFDFDGKTCVHLEVLAQRIDKLASLIKLGGITNIKYT